MSTFFTLQVARSLMDIATDCRRRHPDASAKWPEDKPLRRAHNTWRKEISQEVFGGCRVSYNNNHFMHYFAVNMSRNNQSLKGAVDATLCQNEEEV